MISTKIDFANATRTKCEYIGHRVIATDLTVLTLSRNSRYKKEPRQMDDEEELWFNGDDEEEVDDVDMERLSDESPIADCYGKIEPPEFPDHPSKNLKSKTLGK